MKNSVNLLSLLLVFILSNFITKVLLAQNEQIRKDISLIAERDLKLFLEKIPIGLETKYGFSNRKEFEKVSLGKPISVLFPTDNFYNIDPVGIKKTNIKVSSIWEVPILVNGNICCLLRMKAINNNCTVIGIGGSLSSVTIDKIFKAKELNKMKEISLLKFPELKSQYLIAYDSIITNEESKCYRVAEDVVSGKYDEESLLNILMYSQHSLKQKHSEYEK